VKAVSLIAEGRGDDPITRATGLPGSIRASGPGGVSLALRGLRVEDLLQVGLKVRYEGEGVPTGAVNTTIYFLYNSADRSLTQDEVNARHEAVRRRLTDRFGWKGSN
jgi:hypothetical protein